MHCPDRKGIVAAVTKFLADHDGNIIDLDQHVDTEQGVFFMRVEWDLAGFAVPIDRLRAELSPLVDSLQATWELHFSSDRFRMAVFVSKQAHCLYDILSRHESGEWAVDVPLVVSNHPDLEGLARRHKIDFEVFPKTPETRAEQEEREIALLKEYRIDFVVLARYMQILTGDFVREFPNRIINIHHSFLPAFAGGKPYHAAHARGVKVIGATSHYVTEHLDEGPIIAQDVIPVSHRDSVRDLVRKGQDLEKVVLARAVWHHLEHRILVYNNKTVVFG